MFGQDGYKITVWYSHLFGYLQLYITVLLEERKGTIFLYKILQ